MSYYYNSKVDSNSKVTQSKTTSTKSNKKTSTQNNSSSIFEDVKKRQATIDAEVAKMSKILNGTNETEKPKVEQNTEKKPFNPFS